MEVEYVEPQISITCNEDNNRRKCRCRGCRASCGFIVLTILITLFALTLGLIIGAAVSETILGALAALIVLAIVLFILAIIKIIMCVCEGRRE